MTTQETNSNKYFSEIKMALMEYASNVLYIKNINRSIAHPKDQKFIIKNCAALESTQQTLLNYLIDRLPSNDDSGLAKPLLFCAPTLSDLHLNHYSTKHFLRLLDTQKKLFVETINAIFVTLYNNSSLETQSQMQSHHNKILKLVGGISSIRLPQFFKRKTSINSTAVAEPNTVESISPDELLLVVEDENPLTQLTDSHILLDNLSHNEQMDSKKLLAEVSNLREKMTQLEKEKIAAEQQRLHIEDERKKLAFEQQSRDEAIRLEHATMAAEQQRLHEETKQQLLKAKEQAAEQAAQLEREKIAAEQQKLREETERQLLEAKKQAAEQAAQLERDKIAAEQQKLREETERQLLEAKKQAAEQAAQLEREKIAAEQQRQREETERLLLEAKKQAAQLEREKIAAEQQRQREETERQLLETKKQAAEQAARLEHEKRVEEQKARDEIARIEREKIDEQNKQQQLHVNHKIHQEELQKLLIKKQELQKKRSELQEIETVLHEKEREQQLIIQELLTVSRQLNKKENELQEILKVKHALDQHLHEINDKLRNYENKKRENAEELLQLERKRRQHAQDATLLENACQRHVKSLPPEITLVKTTIPSPKRHNLELEEAAARLKHTGTEERT